MQRKIVKYSNAALCVFISMTLLFVPFNVNILKGAHIEKNEANAIPPAFAGAYAFLEITAAASGLTVGELVATVAGTTAVASGMAVGTEVGINLGNSASDNLNNLIDAADYPDWNTLSAQEQASWGSRDNYDASKFNSLMSAYGLGDAYGRYQNGWGQGGNDQFSFSSTERSNIEKLGSIGENWINGAGNTIEDILSGGWINTQIIENWVPATAGSIDGSKIQGWPSNYPSTINFIVSTQYNTVGVDNRTYNTNVPVYMFVLYDTSASTYSAVMLSDQTFNYKRDTATSWSTASHRTGTDYDYYIYSRGVSGYTSSNLPVNNVNNIPNGNNFVYNAIAHGTYELDDNEISGYPEQEISDGTIDETIVYYPIEGINSSTTWDDLLTETEQITEDLAGIITLLRHIDSDLHQFSFYSNGLLKVHDEGVFNELSDIYALLMEISSKITSNDVATAPEIIGDFDFDEISDRVPNLLEVIENVAPFGAFLILTELYTVLSSINPIEEPQLIVPFQFGGLDDNQEVIIDLAWMDDIKPVINFFCILMLFLAMTSVTMRIVELEAAS